MDNYENSIQFEDWFAVRSIREDKGLQNFVHASCLFKLKFLKSYNSFDLGRISTVDFMQKNQKHILKCRNQV